MAHAYHEIEARALIKTIIDAVTDVGEVHNYERFADDWETLVSFFVTELADETQLLRGWTIGLESMRQSTVTFGGLNSGSSKQVDYTYKIRGWEAVSDEDQSELDFVAIVLEVMDDLDNNATLHSGNLEGSGGAFDADPVQARLDFRMFGSVLTHYVELTQVVREVV